MQRQCEHITGLRPVKSQSSRIDFGIPDRECGFGQSLTQQFAANDPGYFARCAATQMRFVFLYHDELGFEAGGDARQLREERRRQRVRNYIKLLF